MVTGTIFRLIKNIVIAKLTTEQMRKMKNAKETDLIIFYPLLINIKPTWSFLQSVSCTNAKYNTKSNKRMSHTCVLGFYSLSTRRNAACYKRFLQETIFC